MLTTVLEVFGALCLVAAAAVLFWPIAIAVAGVAALLFSWRLSR